MSQNDKNYRVFSVQLTQRKNKRHKRFKIAQAFLFCTKSSSQGQVFVMTVMSNFRQVVENTKKMKNVTPNRTRWTDAMRRNAIHLI